LLSILAACGDDTTGMAGITVTPTTGLRTTEMGGDATFTVVLDTQPEEDVTIALSSSDTGEGTVSPATLTFTADNWDAPQTVTVTGVDDTEADGDATYTIVTAAATSADPDYEGLDADDVSVTNTDDETAGITVEPTSGLTTNEMGGTDTFTIVLNAQPTADVTIALSSSDTGEGTVSPASVTFTVDDWSAPQTITVTGVDDPDADGPIEYTIVTGAANSTDSEYAGIDPADVSVTNVDDETAGITVDPLTGLTTTEAGGTATFTVVLNSAPSGDVTIPLTSSDEGEGTVSPATLTFTVDDWNAPQTITVTGVDDALADGNQVYTIATGAATSADDGYDGLDASDVEVTNTDDETAGITVDPVTGLVTTEAGGTATFTIVLNSEPSADVTIGLTSSDEGEGTVSPASVVFTTTNWNAPQTVTLTGVNDDVADGDQPYTIVTAPATSTDTSYDTLDASNVDATNTDDDSPGVTVTPTSGLTTTEAGGTATFTVVLNSAPTADVVFALTSSDTGEGTVAPAMLTFTATSWNAPQTVTLTGVDDALADGDQPYTARVGAAASGDAGYAGIDPPDVAATNVDNDSAGITVTPTSGLTTTESAGEASFTIVLNAEPVADVTIPLTSSDTGEGTVSPASVTFTTANWNSPQTITVTGVDDTLVDGNQPYTVRVEAATSTDTDYAGLDAPDVSLTNVDNDTAGILVTPTTGLRTSEAGGTATFTVVLTSEPTADVTIDLMSNDTTEGTVGPASLTFTSVSWNAPQTVTVTGVADAIFDGDQVYRILLAPATSADADYDGIDPADVTVTNRDLNAGVYVTPTTGLETTEAGGTATFDVVLNVAPTSNVTISLTSNDTGEGTVSPTSMTFTPANWDAPQTATVRGIDDATADGDQPYTIVTGLTVSADLSYNGLVVDDVSVTNLDDETAAFIIGGNNLVVTEEGGTATFRVRLQSQPTADVTLPLRVSDATEGTISTMSLTFTPANWAALQTVVVTGVDDLLADGNQPFSVITDPATSADPSYNGRNPRNVACTNLDNETAGFIVDPVSIITREDGTATPQYGIRLTSEPTADVTIDISSSDTNEGTPSPASLTFTPLNWNAVQNVTVTGVDDAVADGDQMFTIVNAPATSTDPGYSGLDPADVSVRNIDDDSAGVTVTPTAGLVTSEAGGTADFTVVLNSQPTANVRVPVRSVDTTEGTVSVANVVFTPVNWNAPQTVTLTGVDDFVADGDILYSAHLDPAVSTDPNYSGIDPDNVFVTNVDDETPGFEVVPTSGLVTDEGGGTATFDIRLVSEPTANVTIALSSSDAGEGTVSPSMVVFTAANWNAFQTVTVTGADDFVADGSQGYTIVTGAASSADTGYDGLNPPNVTATNTDDDSPGVTVTTPGSAGRRTTEAGGTFNFTVRLNSQPTANVSLGLSSSDTGEGTVSPMSLTFTTVNWNAPQIVTVTGVDDFLDDGNQPYTIVTGDCTSADGGYSGLVVADVAAVNVDNETAGILVSPTSGLITNELGSTDTFTVRLASQPTASVTVPVASGDTTEGTVMPSSLTFTTANWNTPQTVTVRGANDALADGNQSYSVSVGPATSSDMGYMGLSGPSVSATNLDDETPGIRVTPTMGLITTEGGVADTFDVVLNSEPLGDVVIALSGNPGEGSLSTAMLTFTSANWNVAQTVTVTGVNDALADGDQSYFVVGDPSGSADGAYAGMTPFTVQVTNLDND
jgi:hypothetical protein